MARLWTCGAELQTATANIEFTAIVTNAPAIETTIKRSGNAAFRIANASATEGIRQLHTAVQGSYFFRMYLYIVAMPTATKFIAGFSITGTYKVALRLTSAGNLQLYNNEDSAQVGSNSSALSAGTWYRVEMACNSTTLASTAVSARIDGTEFASGTIDITATPTSVMFAETTGDATLDYIVDDLAINDNSGSFQNSFPGEGEVIVLRPSAVGDVATWARGGTDTGANWSQVSEVPPDTVSWIEENTNNANAELCSDDFNLGATPAAMASDDVINVVQVGCYAGVDSATGADPDIALGIKAASGGTIEESASLDVNSTTLQGPAPAPASNNYALTLYDLPGSSTTAWTKADLDAALVRVRLAVTDTHFARVHALWVTVDHKPSPADVISVNQANETDTAQAVSRIKNKAVGQNTETDLSQAIAKIKQLVTGQNLETDLAQSITRQKVYAIAQIAETDLAQTITVGSGETVIPVAQVSETDSTFSVTVRKIVSVTQVTETDTPQLILSIKIVALGQVTESELAQAISRTKIYPVLQTVESDLVQALSPVKYVPVTQVSSAEIAQAIAAIKQVEVGQVSETDSAQGISKTKIAVLAQTTESNLAQPITSSGAILIQQVEETDLAQSLFPFKRVAVAQTIETDTSQTIAIIKRLTIGQVFETDQAQTITAAGPIIVILEQAVEINSALVITLFSSVPIAHYIYVVPAESRVYVIPFETVETSADRVVVIPVESRISEVAHD